MIIGDFNAILSSNEKVKGLSPSKRCSHFGDFVNNTELETWALGVLLLHGTVAISLKDTTAH